MSHQTSSHSHEVRTYLAVYALLLVLLGITVIAAQFEVGRWNLVVTLAIASTKAILIVLYFMHVKHGTPLVKLVVIIGIFWMVIMVTLTISDYWTRPWDPLIDLSGSSDPSSLDPGGN